jgi:hypothetical protein
VGQTQGPIIRGRSKTAPALSLSSIT